MKTSTFLCVLAAVASCAVTPVSQAVVWFRNTGTVSSGWDGSNLDANCSIANSTSVIYKGSSAIKATATYNSSHTGRYHAMKVKNNGYKLNDTGFYGFAFYLSSSWDFTGSQQYQLFQFIANYANTGCDDWQPSTMIWIAGNQLATRRNYGSSACNRSTTSHTGLATVSRGVWHRVVLQARWVNSSSGFMRLWFDGRQILNVNGPTTINDPRSYRMDVGLYANSWYDQKRLVGSGNRQAWFDNISTGSTYAEADPAAW